MRTCSAFIFPHKIGEIWLIRFLYEVETLTVAQTSWRGMHTNSQPSVPGYTKPPSIIHHCFLIITNYQPKDLGSSPWRVVRCREGIPWEIAGVGPSQCVVSDVVLFVWSVSGCLHKSPIMTVFLKPATVFGVRKPQIVVVLIFTGGCSVESHCMVMSIQSS